MSDPSPPVSEAIQLHADDNVATIRRVRDAGAGACLVVFERNESIVELKAQVAFGHKIALSDIAVGDPITKYGQRIGIAKAAISAGEHVHVHNVVGGRDTGQAYALSVKAGAGEGTR